MKLLPNTAAWKQWVQREDGQSGYLDHSKPGRFPCYAYMEVQSRALGTVQPVYLYQHDLDAMGLELMAFAQGL